ncbi:MAG: DUF4214 domain-containing protein, partial [Deltaproteobacteria bacterium]|nr:DUF4214 domain-containing protein [Deltaproteobacteria bacterium]
MKALGSGLLRALRRVSHRLRRLAATPDIAHWLLIHSLYKGALGRVVDPELLATRIYQLQSGVSAQGLAEELVASAEFQARHGSSQKVDTEYLTALYRDGLGRQPDPEELAHWLAEGAKGATRAKLLVAFSASDEAIAKVTNLYVCSLYRTALGRSADKVGLTNCIRQVQSGSTLDAVAEGVVRSPEFQSRHGTNQNIDVNFLRALYRDGLGRQPDP